MAANVSLPQVAAKHFLTIEQLSLHTPGTQTAQTSDEASPAILAGLPAISPEMSAVLLFFLLFMCAIGIQLVQGVRGLKNYFLSFVLALVVASIPVVLDYVHTGGGQRAKAGPQEVPKHVQIDYQDPQSVVLKWETDVAAYGGARYSVAPFTLSASKFYTANETHASTSHTVIIHNLKNNSVYDVEVLSGTQWYGAGESAYIEFRFVH